MYIDKGYYIGKLRSREDDLRLEVLDYLMAFLRRRNGINKGIPVEMIRRHCESTLQIYVPMDAMIGALLEDHYTVNCIKGQWYAGVSWDSPIGRMVQHKHIDRISLDALHRWYGDLIDPTTGERYDLQ